MFRFVISFAFLMGMGSITYAKETIYLSIDWDYVGHSYDSSNPDKRWLYKGIQLTKVDGCHEYELSRHPETGKMTLVKKWAVGSLTGISPFSVFFSVKIEKESSELYSLSTVIQNDGKKVRSSELFNGDKPLNYLIPGTTYDANLLDERVFHDSVSVTPFITIHNCQLK